MGISSSPNGARLYKIGKVYRENGNFDLEVLFVQSDCDSVLYVKEVSTSKKIDRKRNK